MKKRIFIAIQYMEIGGVERSMLGLLDAIDYARYEVDLFVYRHSGELMPYINPKANLLPEIAAYTTLTRPLSTILREGYVGVALGRLWARFKSKKFGKRNTKGENYSIYQYIADATTRFMPQINDVEYDLAISFITPHNIVRDKVRAKRKVAWIHTDYSNIAVDVERELKTWGTYDYIASISEEAKRAFVSKFPTLADKVVVIENILSVNFVREQALLENPRLDGGVKLLTVGRFCYPKAMDHAVRICARLVEMGLPVKWYAVGYGDEKPIQDALDECQMRDHFFILGKKENPYPYILACDIYVQPSRYEGKAVTVREAQVLGKPVAITAFQTSASQLTDGFDGVIVPMDVEGAAEALKSLIENKDLQEKFRHNTTLTDYGNSGEVGKIYDLI